jgi:hypothetical protein
MNWREDLHSLFDGGITERAELCNVFFGRAPFIKLSNLDDIRSFFVRVGRAELLKNHLEDLEKTTPPGIDEEIRMRQEFTSEVVGASKAQYTIFGTVWYTHQLNTPLSVRLLIAVSPRGLEGLVQAELKEISKFVTVGAARDSFARVFIPGKGKDFVQPS